MAPDGTTTTTVEGGSIQSNSIPSVDLSLLSQSQLLSLSLYSPPPSFGDDVVIPIIDRSVFNESAGSRKQTYSRLRLAPSSFSGPGLRRRAPHLRSFSSINPASFHPDNARIVTILKQLFLSNTTDLPPRDAQLLVPVKLDYSPNSILTSDVTSVGLKRKRGRPRKDEIFKSMEIESNLQVDVNEIDVRENVEHGNKEVLIKDTVVGLPLPLPLPNGGDKEVLNKDGVAVDLVALGSVDHPFWDEIMQRTEGLKGEEEFLSFMKGLNGQWGSRRKKKRIVDASQFGNALPIGWKLLLSAKRKSGHVWLYCRRYISPSGRQFVSCKEVSSYLLSLHGVEAVLNDADQLTSASVENLAPQNDSQKESLASHASSPSSVFRSDSSIMKAPDLPDTGVGESLHCKKCDIIFNERVEFLQHKTSLHPKNRNRNAVSLTDGVIFKDGKYECQFCHKMFEERHRYNGHIGAHVRYQAKMAGEFPASGMEKSTDQISSNDLSVQDAAIESAIFSEICNVSVDNGLNSPLHDEDTDDVGNLIYTTENMRGRTDEATDAVMGRNDEATDMVMRQSDEATNMVMRQSDEATNDGATDMVMGQSDKATDMVMRQSDEATDTVTGGDDEATDTVTGGDDEATDAVMERSDEAMGPSDEATDAVGAQSPCSVDEVIIPGCENKDSYEASDTPACVNGSATEIVADDHIIQERYVNCLPCEEKTKDVGCSQPDQDVSECSLLHSNNNIETSNIVESNGQGYQASSEPKLECRNVSVSESVFEFFEDHDVQHKDFGNTNSTSNQQHDINILDHSNNEKSCGEENVHSSTEKITADESSFGTLSKGVPEMVVADEDMRRETEMQFGITSSTPWNLEENLCREYEFDEVSACLFKEPVVQNTYGTNDNSVCGRNMEVPEFDAVQNFSDGNPFSKSQTCEQDRKLGVGPDFSSLTDKQYFKEDIFNSALEKHKPGSILFGQLGVSKVSDVGFNANIYPTTENQSRINESESNQSYGLSLSVDNFQTELHHPAASNRFEQERVLYPTTESCYSINKIYDDGPSVSNIHSGLRQGQQHLGINFLDSSFNSSQQHNKLGGSFNGGDWNARRDQVPQKTMFGFGSNSSQPHERNGSWTTGCGNMFRSFDDGPQVQGSRNFRNFDLMPDRGGEGGVYSTNNIGRNNNPVEYSFMEKQSSTTNNRGGHSQQQQMFPYTNEQRPFWLQQQQNNTTTNNNTTTTSTNQVPTACMWCGNMFYHDAARMQTVNIGSMCPSCSSRMPGHFNLL